MVDVERRLVHRRRSTVFDCAQSASGRHWALEAHRCRVVRGLFTRESHASDTHATFRPLSLQCFTIVLQPSFADLAIFTAPFNSLCLSFEALSDIVQVGVVGLRNVAWAG